MANKKQFIAWMGIIAILACCSSKKAPALSADEFLDAFVPVEERSNIKEFKCWSRQQRDAQHFVVRLDATPELISGVVRRRDYIIFMDKEGPVSLRAHAFAEVVERVGNPDAPSWCLEFINDLSMGYVRDADDLNRNEAAFVSSGKNRILILFTGFASGSTNHGTPTPVGPAPPLP